MDPIGKPPRTDLPAFYAGYVEHAPGDHLIDSLVHARQRMLDVLGRVPADQGDHRYAPGKWSIKEVVQHVIDSERIFAYRALRFARNDATPLPGFDENSYAPAARANRRTLHELITEFKAVSTTTDLLYASLDAEALASRGLANGSSISVVALGWVIAGHTLHHAHILDERYLNMHPHGST